MSWDDKQEIYYSGQGVVLIASKDPTTGEPLGFSRLGNVPEMKIAVDSTVDKHKESKTGSRTIDRRLTTETALTFTLTAENFSAANLAIAQRGTATALVAGTVVAEPSKLYIGKILALGHINVSLLVVTKGVTPLVAYVDEVTPYDYKVNLEGGSIEIADVPDTAGLIDGDDITYDYSYAAQTHVEALEEAAETFWIRLEGVNTAENNDPLNVDIFAVSFDPTKELDLIGDDIQSFVLEGDVLSDSTRLTGSKLYREMAVA